MTQIGYALNLYSAAQYAALALEGAASAALSVEELAAKYNHPVAGDLARVQIHEAVEGDTEAKRWIIWRALSLFGEQMVETNGRWRYAPNLTLEELVWKGESIKRVKPNLRLGTPFDPNKDSVIERRYIEFEEAAGRKVLSSVRIDGVGIRSIRTDDTAELEESLDKFGWLEQFPALVTSQGVIIAGRRRMEIANRLGITPVTQVINLPRGDSGDAKRLRIAIASNIGIKPMTPTDRKRLAVYLTSSEEWDLLAISTALQASETPGRSTSTKRSVDRLLIRDRVAGVTPKMTRTGKSFEKFHEANPRVYDMLVRFAREWVASTEGKISARQLLYRAAWEMAMTTGLVFEFNNNHTPYYSRWIEFQEPDLDGVFQMREGEADAWIALKIAEEDGA